MQTNTSRTDEINIFKIYYLLKKHKYLLAGIPLFITTVALIIASQLAPVWESSALIQIGHLANSPIESLQVITPKLMNKSFLNEIESQLEQNSDLTEIISTFESSLKVAPRKGTELLEISLRSPSSQSALNLAKQITNSIISSHSKLSDPAIQKLRSKLDSLFDDKKRLDSQFKILQSQITIKSNPSVFMFTTYTMQNILAEIRDAKDEISILEDQLNPLKTYPTSLIGEISISGPITPPKLIIGITTFMFSFLVVFGLIYFRYLIISRE